ncbi:MAG: DNA mismatch repair endonuclease MutL [Cellulosilyticaceae bacterium]
MASIRLLDTHTINKIAAGEVVERPASVIKELVENSIDAGATSITVEIKNGGIDMIRITDNGKGIPKDEVEIAFLRHATSKITSAEDLNSVLSLGFRGEALASIAAVSWVELLTKQSDELTGKRVTVAGGKLQTSEEIACPVGSTIIMKNLFYNVPARKEFLKTPGAEGAKISDYMYKLAMAHPEISFKYIQNTKLVFQTSGQYDLVQCVYQLFGKETSMHLIPFQLEQDHIEVSGVAGKPTLTRANRNYEYFFINGRYIRSFVLQRAVENAYKTLLTIGKFPFVVVHLKIQPDWVDVNVHPTKLEVRFKDEERIYQVVYEAISTYIKAQNLIPKVGQDKPLEKPQIKPNLSIKNNTQLAVESFFTPRTPPKDYTPKELVKVTPPSAAPNHIFEPKRLNTTVTKVQEDKGNANYQISPESDNVWVAPAEAKIADENPLEAQPVYTPKEGIDYQIIGQLFATYWIIEHHQKVLLIDQHAAHERIMYEKFMKDFMEGSVATQMLLVPETIKLTDSEFEIFKDSQRAVEQLGFKVEEFGENTLLIREVPFVLNKPMGTHVLKDMVDYLISGEVKNLRDMKEETIIQLACKSAIKAHDTISELECKTLIAKLLMLENPYTCPHGRPTIVALQQSDLEKIFKRIQ